MVDAEEVLRLLSSLLARSGASAFVADVIARACVAAERDGSASHGLFRVPGYVADLRSGWVDGRAEPVVSASAPARLDVDARNGYAQPALERVRERLAATARTFGIATAAIRDAHHLGALWIDVEPFAREGLIAIAMANGIARVVPYGARRPVFGTNPFAFAMPRAAPDPLVVDLSTAAMAFGDVRLAAREGRSLPAGVGIDRTGAPTTDPEAIVDGGALLPFGDHKGASLALFVEIMAAALTGASPSTEAGPTAHPGAQSARAGELLIVIDPASQAGDAFEARIEALLAAMRAGGAQRLPGERRYARRHALPPGKMWVASEALDRLRAAVEDGTG